MPVPQFERDDVRAVLFHEFGGALRFNAHHGAEGRAVESDVVGHGADDALCARCLGCLDADQQLFKRGLRFDDDGVGAAIDQRRGLFFEGAANLGFSELAERLEQAAEGADVAEHVAFLVAEGLARDLDAGLVDFDDVVRFAMAGEHDARSAKGVGDDAIRAGLDVAALDGEHSLGMRQIPGLAAIALLQAGEHELRAHRAVAEQRPLQDCLLQEVSSSWSPCLRSNSFCARA